MATIDKKLVKAIKGLVSEVKTSEGIFYNELALLNGTCRYVKESTEYAGTFSGICKFMIDGEVIESWVNFAHGETPTIGAHNPPFEVAIKLLEVSEDATEYLLEKYNKNVGDRVLRAYVM